MINKNLLYGFANQCTGVSIGDSARDVVKSACLDEWIELTGLPLSVIDKVVIRYISLEPNNPNILLYILSEQRTVYFANIISTNIDVRDIPAGFVDSERELLRYRINKIARGSNVVAVHMWCIGIYDVHEVIERKNNSVPVWSSGNWIEVWNPEKRKMMKFRSHSVNGKRELSEILNNLKLDERSTVATQYLKAADLMVVYEYQFVFQEPFMSPPVTAFSSVASHISR